MKKRVYFEPYEIDFIRESFSENWPVRDIADKLDRHVDVIYNVIAHLGLKRPGYGVKTPTLDWPSIWYAYCQLGRTSLVAEALKIRRQSVKHAVMRMIYMTAEQRLAVWNNYARANGRDLYTIKDASVCP